MLRNLGTLVLLLLLATPLAAVAQNTGRLAGVVTDDLGDPLPGANVVIEGTQLGAAADIDGNYFIIGVPVGEYSITASFVGYQTQTVEGVTVSSGYTTEQNFELGPQELGEVVVEYEPPIIQRDAIGVPRVVSGEQLQNLPVRGAASVASIQAGVVSNEGSDNLFIRGGRSQEVVYYVDGVKVTGNASTAVNQQAIQEQEMLIGTIPARYGDALSGVISITTKSGGNEFFGSVEAITSEVLDSYGYNLGSVSIGGPIVPERASFFASVSGNWQADRNPYGKGVLTLNDDVQAMLAQTPEGIRVRNPQGGLEIIPINPDDLIGVNAEDFLANPGNYGLNLEDGYTIDSPVPVSMTQSFTESDFSTSRSKRAPLQELTFNGNVTINPVRAISLRLGGAFENSERETYSYASSFYNPDNFSIDDRQTWRMYGTFRQRVADNAFYQIQGEYQNWNRESYPQRFGSDMSNILFYGDIDHESNVAAARYLTLDGNGNYIRRIGDGSFGSAGSAYGFFSNPGAFSTTYIKQDESTLRFSGNATTQLGVHQLEFGAEFEQRTRRLFQVVGAQLALLHADGNVEAGGEGVSSYEDLTFQHFDDYASTHNYYGYSFNGLQTVDDQDIDAYGQGTNANVAPHKPIYYAGYIQDKIEFRDLVINLGARVDVFDNNTLVLKDMFAPYPVMRAGGLDGFGEYAGLGIEEDYAVYFANTNDLSSVVGFRDLDGNFYDLDGNVISRAEMQARGTPLELNDHRNVTSEMFEDYTPQVTFMPRVGVSFPVTDRALFFASYNVTSQRPTEQAFTPFSTYDELSIGTQYSNPNLKPERTTQYELGFRQRVGERAAVTLSGFYRTQENKIGVRNLGDIAAAENNAYSTFLNVDQTTAKGVELGFDLRRTNNLAINANYTLSFAEGTGSDASTASNLAWLNRAYPVVVFPTDFDRRHSGNISVDYRFGEDEGPMIGGVRLLENFGINLLGTFRSGLPYTRTQNTVQITTSQALRPRGGVNEARLPGSAQIDLKIDRSFDLGFGALNAYLWVQNVLDTASPLTVYRFTGSPETSGFLATSAGEQAVNSALSPESYLFHYQQFEGGPVNVGSGSYVSGGGGGVFYTPPRRIRLGILLDF